MTWTSFHRRGEILRSVIHTADARLDGLLPMDVDGVHETYGDPLSLLGALHLRWHTRLAGRIERELVEPWDGLEAAVVAAWRATADDLPGIRAILDHYRAEPLDDAMAEAMTRSAAKEHLLLAAMAGRAGVYPGQTGAAAAAAVRVGRQIEDRARVARARLAVADVRRSTLLGRLRAALAA